MKTFASEPTPFFIVGCVRSGTTLLRDILKLHPNLACPEETHFFRWSHPFGVNRFEQIHRESDLLKKHRAFDGTDESAFLELLTTAASRKELMARYADLYRRAINKPEARWFDKTPQHVYGMLLLSAAFPGAKFIHIHRNPLNVVSSLLEGKVMPVHSLVGAINYWLEAAMIINRYKATQPPGDLYEIAYETFTEKPERELAAMLTFLGEDVSLLNFPPETVYPESNKYLQRLSREAAEQVRQRCEPYFSQYGYQHLPLPEALPPAVPVAPAKPLRPKTKTLILVLGMHRSGTSAAARLLNLLGVELGSDLMQPMPGVNDSGFWEHRGFKRIHEEVLAQLGSAWFDTRPLPENWPERDDIRSFHAQILDLLRSDFSERAMIGVKDPRLCRLAPLWRDALAAENIELKCVLVARHPLETAHSLEKRDGFHLHCGLDLWMLHLLESELFSRGLARTLVRYEDLLQDPQTVSTQISVALDLSWPVTFSAAADEIRREIRVELQHQRADDTISETAPAFPYVSLYHRLAEGLTPSLAAHLDQLRERFQPIAADVLFKTHQELASRAKVRTEIGETHHHALSVIQERDQQLALLNEQLRQLGAEHDYALKIMLERDQQLTNANAQLDKLGSEHAEALAVLRERDRQVAELWAQHHALGQSHSHAMSVVAERDRQLAEIQAHWSYQLNKFRKRT